ncbi:unnamed protein product [Rotaria magnacalcarata]|uniref:Peptidase M12B domain-containing protein n=3 Tax=Rotaria magnacalcarata TaxID=392030 RepID=A0A8S2L931_9BILA|nr:unnamed protein product [Rotaria magnacalcarata]
MLRNLILFFLCQQLTRSQRYYAFVETLFVVDPNYFPSLSVISYEDYIRAIVDTTNIIFQSQNDLDIKVEIIISSILQLNIVQPKSQQPYEYENILRQTVFDYERYDSIVLFWYQPWERSNGAQGYAMLKGACHPSYKIMYLIPYQNAAFYLAHEFGHQLGLVHQVDTPCYTNSYMSVMTKSHTVSYEQARWSQCENKWINNNICGYGVAFNGGLQGSAEGSYSSYEATSTTGYGSGAGTNEAQLGVGGGFGGEYHSSSANEGYNQQGGLDASLANSGAGGNYYSSASHGDFNQQGFLDASSTAANGYSSDGFQQRSSSLTTSYATDSQGLYQDPNPQIVRRPAAMEAQTYVQRVMVRFLQPPPVPPPGPLIIKEVRPPQPPPPPPLYIRQRPAPPPVLPPIVIREAPPKMPAAVGTQVITKLLPPLPVPPRSVIIERLPPLPPKPRDVVVERWLPYRAQQKRRVIVQRAPPPVVQKPRNIIIYYEPPKAQIVRRFLNLGVERANPTEYVARYGTQLEDSHALISHARQAGVVEDISPPGGAASNLQSSTYGSYQSSDAGFAAGGYDVSGGFSTGNNAAYGVSGGLSTFGGAAYSAGTDSSVGYSAGYSAGAGAGVGYSEGADYGVGAGAGYSVGTGAGAGYDGSGSADGFSSSSYESSSSYGTVGGAGGLESSFGGLSLIDNTSGLVGSNSSYESYTSQTYG